MVRDINKHLCSKCGKLLAERKPSLKNPKILEYFDYIEYEVIEGEFICKECIKKAKGVK